ncbi:hypothetical protein AB4865_12100 [Capnocytophaga sp. ARDL2]|uniref:hypothetical protein n=1 Tax=Capnocytophaga sp. ARDL2 TaxID=3238809 RepID=UPI003556EE2B
MKKGVVFGIALATVLGSIISCNKVKEMKNAVTQAAEAAKGVEDIEFQMFSKPEEVQKWYNLVIEKAGAENAKVMDEVKFTINGSSPEGSDKYYLLTQIVYQDNVDKRRVQEILYHGLIGGWQPAETKEINVIGIGAENFRLEDELFDFTKLTSEILNKAVADAWTKYKDDQKYEEQYIRSIEVRKGEIEIVVKGKIKANGVEKIEIFRTSW